MTKNVIKSFFYVSITLLLFTVLSQKTYAKDTVNRYFLKAIPSSSTSILLYGKDGKKEIYPKLGKPFLLHIWATWCNACREELPQIWHYSQTHKEIPLVIAVTKSGSYSDVKAGLLRMGIIDLPILDLSDKQYDDLLGENDHFLPVTLLLDGRGRVRAYSDGTLDWHDRGLTREINRRLKQLH